MKGLKEITVFSIGDSNSLKTWSNVPYFFTRSLEQKGIKVNRVNLEENKFLERLYKLTVYAVLKMFYRSTQHTYFRSGLNYFITQQKIRKAIKQYPDSELNVFLSFSFNAHQFSDKPYLLFGDWTYKYYIQHFLNRQAFWFEKTALKREANNIAEAKLVLALFPLSANDIKTQFKISNCHYLGNVINADWPLHQEQLLADKTRSKKIIFIGNSKYIIGAKDLMAAFERLSNKIPGAELHIIGLSEEQTGNKTAGVYCHGYLDKSDAIQKAEYYQLLTSAKMIVNPTKGWGAFSSVTEAMYFYTPVIIRTYNEFTETYGQVIDFGYYIAENNEQHLEELMVKVFQQPDEAYQKMMLAAHKAVEGFSWDNYSTRLLNLLSSNPAVSED